MQPRKGLKTIFCNYRTQNNGQVREEKKLTTDVVKYIISDSPLYIHYRKYLLLYIYNIDLWIKFNCK